MLNNSKPHEEERNPCQHDNPPPTYPPISAHMGGFDEHCEGSATYRDQSRRCMRAIKSTGARWLTYRSVVASEV
jgi:hypothetical protein